MSKLLKTLIIIFQVLKVLSIVLAAIYLVFWFYRFFNLPFTDYLVPLFEILITPIKAHHATIKIYHDSILEMAYFVLAIILFIFTFIFSVLERTASFIDNKHEIYLLQQRVKMEKKVNEELRADYIADRTGYRYFSAGLKFKVTYLNSMIANINNCSLESCLENSMQEFIKLFGHAYTNVRLLRQNDFIFITGEDFNTIDNIIPHILNAIRTIKVNNTKMAIDTSFLLAFDAQNTRNNNVSSISKIQKLLDMNYLNTAVVTSDFKKRFDLLQQYSNFMTDVLGFSNTIQDSNDIFVLKSKRRV